MVGAKPIKAGSIWIMSNTTNKEKAGQTERFGLLLSNSIPFCQSEQLVDYDYTSGTAQFFFSVTVCKLLFPGADCLTAVQQIISVSYQVKNTELRIMQSCTSGQFFLLLFVLSRTVFPEYHGDFQPDSRSLSMRMSALCRWAIWIAMNRPGIGYGDHTSGIDAA